MSNFVLRFVVNLQPLQLYGSSGCSTSSPTLDYVFPDDCNMVFIKVLLYIRLTTKTVEHFLWCWLFVHPLLEVPGQDLTASISLSVFSLLICGSDLHILNVNVFSVYYLLTFPVCPLGPM